MNQVVIAYIPVLHQGYLRFLQTHAQAQIYVLGSDLIAEFDHLRKDVRALEPEQVSAMLQGLGIFREVTVLSNSMLADLKDSELCMPDEDIMHELAEKYFPTSAVLFENVFLRWDKMNTVAQIDPQPDEVITHDEFDQKMMQLAYTEAAKSPDWWRHVGAVLVRDGAVVLTAHNHYVPDEQRANYAGDPRGNFHKGVYIELGIAMHAEAEIICQAAAQGISTTGCELYATTFPCPACAKLVAYSGITKLYFAEGYSLVDGATVMKEKGMTLIKVTE